MQQKNNTHNSIKFRCELTNEKYFVFSLKLYCFGGRLYALILTGVHLSKKTVKKPHERELNLGGPSASLLINNFSSLEAIHQLRRTSLSSRLENAMQKMNDNSK